MSSRLGPNGRIVRPSSASRRAAASRVNIIDLTDDAPGAARPILPNDPYERTSGTGPLLYAVSAHHHYPWEPYGLGENTDFVGIFATLEEAKNAARGRLHYEECRADGWEYRWDQDHDRLILKARREDYEDDVETLTVSINAARQRSAKHGMRAGHRIGQEACKEELRRGLGEELKKELREELEEELREELKAELMENLFEELREEAKEELSECLFQELREELKEELRVDPDEDLREEVKEELKEELDEELRDEVKEELMEESEYELRQELKEELEEEVKEELTE